jgi:hypothetical protein
MGTQRVKAQKQGVPKLTIDVLAIKFPQVSPTLPRCALLVCLAHSFLVSFLAELGTKPLPNISPIFRMSIRPAFRSQLAPWSLAQRTM